MNEYFKNVEVDDKVYSVVYGEGTVLVRRTYNYSNNRGVCETNEYIDILLERNKEIRYSLEGTKADTTELQTLFYSKPKFDLPPEPIREYQITYGENSFTFDAYENLILQESNEDMYNFETKVNLGVVRHRKEQAEESLKRNLQTNRLEALVYDTQGSVGGNHTIEEIDNYKYRYIYNDTGCFSIGEILMAEKTAIKICELLNSGKSKLT